MISIAFLNQLAAAQSEAEFARTAAGFTALQVYDSIKSQGYDPLMHQTALQRLERNIAEIDSESTLRGALSSMVQVLPFWESSGAMRIGRRAVYTALICYGQALGDEGEWAMAENVHSLAGADAELDGEIWIAAEARLLMGRASRMCADWEASRVAYRRAYQLGMEAGDMAIALRAQIGDANNLWSRGDFPTAKRRLAVIARRAKELCPSIVPRVTLALAGVANAAGEYERAINLAFELLVSLDDDDELRYQTLVDMSIFLTDYGLPPVAAAALRVVERTAPQPRIRRQAKLNLFFLATKHEDETTFNRLHLELSRERLTTREQTQHALFAAYGYRRFARWDAAHAVVTRAIRLATQFQFFQLVFEAEAELREIEIARSATRLTQMAAHAEVPTGEMEPHARQGNSGKRTSALDIVGDTIPPRMRHVAEALASMVAATEPHTNSVL